MVTVGYDKKVSVWDGELDLIHNTIEETSGNDSDSSSSLWFALDWRSQAPALTSSGHCAFLSFGEGHLNLSTMPYNLEYEEKIYVTTIPQKLWAFE